MLYLISRFTFLFLAIVCIPLTYASDYFIPYTGALSGSIIHNAPDIQKLCGSYYFANLTNTTMSIGLNDPEVKYPFFFDLWRLGNRTTPRDPSKGCIYSGGCTDDAIFNLFFTTFQEDDNPFESHTYINVNASRYDVVSDRDLTATDQGAFYAVTGDQSTWFPRLGYRRHPFFNLQAPQNYTLSADCIKRLSGTFFAFSLYDVVEWNDTTPFTYNLNFTNNTMVSQFTISTPVVNVSLVFNGERFDNGSGFNASKFPIALADPREHPQPHFTYTNGTEFMWLGGRLEPWRNITNKTEGVPSAAIQNRESWGGFLGICMTLVMCILNL